MTPSELITLLPFLIVTATGVFILLGVCFYRNHFLALITTIVGLACALAVIAFQYTSHAREITSLIVVDGYTLFFSAIIISSTIATALLSYQYLEYYFVRCEELYILLVFAALGAMVIVASVHFASFFLGLEILGIALYTAISYLRTDRLGIEAGIKYLILSATADTILLFGMAVLYGQFGTLELGKLAHSIGERSPDIITFTGEVLVVGGIGFKLSLVPFHMWTPDVYEGAPAPITGFLATVSKGSVFALLTRYFAEIGYESYNSLVLLFSLLAIISMIGGNLLALLQVKVKRILAYASIAHMGYLLVAFISFSTLMTQAVGYYLAAYFAATLGAFGVIGVMNERQGVGQSDLDEYRGLFWRKPGLAAVFTIMLLSLAGIPLTAGFVGKFYIIAAGAEVSLWALIIVFVAANVIGLFYYIRIIAYMCLPLEIHDKIAAQITLGRSSQVVLVLLALAVLVLGIFPAQLIGVLQESLPF